MTSTQDPVRLLTLTTLFPSSVRPRHGIFVANRLRRMCATGRVVSKVVAAVPWFPGFYGNDAAVPREERWEGIPVRHPRFLNVPGVGMRLQPTLLARSLLQEIRRAGWSRDDFDVVDAHYFYPDGVAAQRVADALGLPLVVSARGSDINLIATLPGPREAIVTSAMAARATIAVSQALADRMRALGMPADRIAVLRNGVDADMFQPVARDVARQHVDLPRGVPLVAGVGNLVAEKGFDLLLRAAAGVPDLHVLLVGEGSEATALEALGARLLPGRLHRRPSMPQESLRYVYCAANALALPSLREGWPNVVLESIACGTPVVAADVGGVREIVQRPDAGVMVAGRDEAAWREALVTTLRTDVPSERVRSCALPFGWDEVVAKQCALYERVRSVARGAQRKGLPASSVVTRLVA